MILVGLNSGGYGAVGRQQSTRAWYPTERVRPVRVEVYWRYVGEVAAAARSLGVFAPGQAVTLPIKRKATFDVILSVVTISPNGIRSVRELADAHEVLIPADAPLLMALENKLSEGAGKHAGRPTVATGVRYAKE